TLMRRGAGEILLTSVDRDGGRAGYDLALTRAVARAVDVPVVASGGAGSVAHVREVLLEGEADAALLAGLLHDRVVAVADIKRELASAGLAVRRAS
ncbi:MAG: HisA/HisF-related TIM barrel protein, partial [Gemmatimonadaceae bacterium]